MDALNSPSRLRGALGALIPRLPPPGRLALGVLCGLVLVLGAYTLILVLDRTINVRSPSMVFLCSVILAAIWFGQAVGLFTAIFAFATYNYFIVAPVGSFMFTGVDPVFTLALFVGTALVIGGMAGRLRDEKVRAGEHARVFEILFGASRAMADHRAIQGSMRDLIKGAQRLGVEQAIVFLADAGGKVSAIGDVADPDVAAIRAAAVEMLRDKSPGQKVGDQWQLYPIMGVETPLAVLACKSPRQADQGLAMAIGLLLGLARTSVQHIIAVQQKIDIETAAQSEQLRAALMASISHDFRTPLATILASTSSLLTYGDDFPAATRSDLLLSVQDEAERLNRYVGNILAMTRLEADAVRPHLQWRDPVEVLESAVQRCSKRSAGRALELETPAAAPSVRLDAVLLEQALTNVIENALRHTPASARIRVGCSHDPKTLKIWVEDEGPGVGAGDLPHLFEKFFRVNDRSDGEGVGLGLAISKGFVEAMGGVISAQSPASLERGLRVTFTFPVQSVAFA